MKQLNRLRLVLGITILIIVRSNAATPAVASAQTGPSYGSGFTSTGLTLNGGAAVSGTRLRMTDGGPDEARSAFFSTPVAVTNFTNTFTFQDTDASGDGFCFVIEASGPTALGGGGGNLGYAGTSGALGNKSLCVGFDLYNNSANREISNTGLFTNGASAANGAGSSTGLSFQSGDLFRVTMNYNGTTLAMQITDTVTKATFNKSFTVDIPSLVGGNTAYVGFTGGDWRLTATQDILAWTYMPTGRTAVATAVTTEPAGKTVAESSGAGSVAGNSATSTVNAGTLILNANAARLSFGTVNVSSSSLQQVIFTNAGTAKLTISNVSISGAGFDASGIPTGTILAPGQSATLSAMFAPAVSGAVSGSVTVTSDAASGAKVVALAGTGAAPIGYSVTLSWSPSTSTVVGYNVYVREASGVYVKLTSKPVAALSYTDSGLQTAQDRYYVVTAVDSSDKESAFSSGVSAVIP
jgi:hypothetical protein